MTRLDQYREFACMVGKLIEYAIAERIPIRFGEAHRPRERAEELARAGKGAMDSKHIYSLAVDIWITDMGGKGIRWKDDRYAKLGEQWKAYGGIWGGDFKGKTAGDIYHFEIATKVIK